MRAYNVSIEPMQKDEYDFFADLSRRTVEFRGRMGWTQEELGQKIGVSRAQVGNWENGNTFLGRKPLTKLIALMRAPVRMLLADVRELGEILEMVEVSDSHKLLRFANKATELKVAAENLMGEIGEGGPDSGQK